MTLPALEVRICRRRLLKASACPGKKVFNVTESPLEASDFARPFSQRHVRTDTNDTIDSVSTRVAQALINAMEAKSPYLRGHSHRVAAVAATVAAELELAEEVIEQVRLAGHLHDVGKIGVREHVLDKPGALTVEEFAHVKEHVTIGLNILAPLSHLGPVLDFIAHHHERTDGSGYPFGLSGNAVSLGGRILGAADALDALTSPRAYRQALPVDEALDSLAAAGSRGICPTVLPALRRLVNGGQVLVFLNDSL
jgi:putative nucleotidyltransferase with HDIG domain